MLLKCEIIWLCPIHFVFPEMPFLNKQQISVKERRWEFYVGLLHYGVHNLCFCGWVDRNLGQRFSCSLIYYTSRDIIMEGASLIPFMCITSSSCDSVNEYLRQRSFLMRVICFAMKCAASKMSNRAYIHGPGNSRPHRSYLDGVVGYFIHDIPYIFESNPHPFYSSRGLKTHMRIRFAIVSWILEKMIEPLYVP